jgi:hypothetical protein
VRTLPAPTANPGALYNACVSATNDKTLRARLIGYQPRVSAAAQSYQTAGTGPNFHTLTRTAGTTDADKELRDLYKRTMSRKGGPGRATYDLLKLSARGGICPLCGHRSVSTLDHYLPKESYADFAILPSNLIPSCSDCNRMKHKFFPEKADEQLLHPYFDHLPQGIWLHASVVYPTDTPILVFKADPPAEWNGAFRARVAAHFDRLDLATLYSIHGTSEVPMIRWRLQKLLAGGGPDVVRDHLQEEASTRQAQDPNSWQAATYSALANDKRFWSGDFGQ